METKKQVNQAIIVFSDIVKKILYPTFKIPRGGENIRLLENWVIAMNDEYGSLSTDRIVDYCVCQAYQLSKFDANYLKTKWKLSHSFAAKGWERYQNTSKPIKYYEDKWLADNSLSRHYLIDLIKDRQEHPFVNLINPEYEETTKSRNLGTDVGYYICGSSTLLYTPFSKSCQSCSKSASCIDRTKSLYMELYRVRLEAWNKNNSDNETQ